MQRRTSEGHAMTTVSPPPSGRACRPPLPPAPGEDAAFLHGPRGALLAAGAFLLVALVALLDAATDSRLSLGLFYLIPVAACAWWGGFPYGVLASLAGTAAWITTDCLDDPTAPPAVRVWNGVVRFGFMALAASLVSRLRVGIFRERRLARTDALTGAANGRNFYEAAAAEAGRSARAARPLTLAYLDLDDFKRLNDRLGHAAGDAALIHLVRTVRAHLRGSDLLARLGGGEFALLLPETGEEGAAPLLARLQEALVHEMARRGWPVTVSIGAVTFLRPEGDVDRMVHRIDARMFAAKRKGKGRVEHAVLSGAAEVGGRTASSGGRRRGCFATSAPRSAGRSGTEIRKSSPSSATCRPWGSACTWSGRCPPTPC
jgi:diguanylate cyclase (GGDEF)-like protein